MSAPKPQPNRYDLDNLPGNSLKSREQDSRPAVKQVAKAIQPNKRASLGASLARGLTEHVVPIGQTLTSEIFLPAVKDIIAELFSNAIDMLIYGDGSGRSSRRGQATHVSYGSYFTGGQAPRRGSSRSSVRRLRSIKPVILATRGEAQDVLDQMGQLMVDYGWATVADLYEMTGIPSVWTDANIGWRDMEGARIQRTREGYELLLKPFSPLE